MDMNLFKNYLKDIDNRLNSPQRDLAPIYEATKSTAGKYMPKGMKPVGENAEFSPEEVVTEYLSSFFGGDLTENTSDEDIIGAVNTLNTLCNTINEWMDDESNSEPTEEVLECLDTLFDDGLTEDTSGDDILEAVLEINAVAEVVNHYFSE